MFGRKVSPTLPVALGQNYRCPLIQKYLTQLSQVDKRPVLDFPRLNTAKDKQCAKRGKSRVRRLPKAGKLFTKAW